MNKQFQHTEPIVTIGIMQRAFPLNPVMRVRLDALSVNTIVIDASPVPIVRGSDRIRVVTAPDEKGFFPICLLCLLFREFLTTQSERLLLLEGDMLPTEETIRRAHAATDNTKIYYVESDPASPHAYVRREGLAGVLLRSEVERMSDWYLQQPVNRLRKYEGYCDSFLWFAVHSETTGYSTSTAGPDWIPVVHITHDDATRVTKKQRGDMKEYRRRFAEVIELALECNRFGLAAGNR